jgi:hypothetical protein
VTVRLGLRLPPALHEQLVTQAAEQDVSLNTLIVMLLAGAVGFTLTDKPTAGSSRGCTRATSPDPPGGIVLMSSTDRIGATGAR